MKECSGWEVFGSGAETRIVQTGTGIPYQEAKKSAIEKLRSVLEPLGRRLAEIEDDVDVERNKIPPCKAWESNNTLVLARTKKRAAELVGTTTSAFGRRYILCTDAHWWYQFAQTEGVWEKQGSVFNPTWEKSLSCEEQRQAARQDMLVDEC